MFLAAKVGVAAFKVGRVAVNTKETFGGLLDEIDLWKVQLEYVTSYFEEVQPFIPPSLHTLALSRLKVLQAYIQRLEAKIEKAEAGDKKSKMMIIGKSSGEMGSSFAQDISIMFANLDESIQFSHVHITSNRILQLKAIDEQLQALGQQGLAALEQQKYISKPLDVVVQSRRLIFLLEWPLIKVAVGTKVPIKWTIAGDIPFVKIEVQVSSLMQQAQDKNKKTFIELADRVACDHTGVGHYTWEVPANFVQLHGKHSNYFFKLTYNPSENKESTSRFTSKVKGATDSFKIYDPAKKAQESKPAQTTAPSHPTSTASSAPSPAHSSSPSTSSAPSSSGKEKEKEKEKTGMMGKASGMVGGLKKKW